MKSRFARSLHWRQVVFLVTVQANLWVESTSAQHVKQLDNQTKVILRGATNVQVFRIRDDLITDSKGNVKASGKGSRFDGYTITTRGADQGKDFASKLADAVLDEKSYGDSFDCFHPGVAFRVWRDKKFVDVLICFTCDNFYCGPPLEIVELENVGFHKSDIRARLVRLAKQSLPSDKEIQSLPEK